VVAAAREVRQVPGLQHSTAPENHLSGRRRSSRCSLGKLHFSLHCRARKGRMYTAKTFLSGRPCPSPFYVRQLCRALCEVGKALAGQEDPTRGPTVLPLPIPVSRHDGMQDDFASPSASPLHQAPSRLCSVPGKPTSPGHPHLHPHSPLGESDLGRLSHVSLCAKCSASIAFQLQLQLYPFLVISTCA